MIKKLIVLLIYITLLFSLFLLVYIFNLLEINFDLLPITYFIVLSWIFISQFLKISAAFNGYLAITLLSIGICLKVLGFSIVSEIVFKNFYIIFVIFVIQKISQEVKG